MQSNIAKSLAITWLLGVTACAEGAISTLSSIDKTQSHLTVSKSTATADGSDSVTIKATVKDNTGSPVAHATVTFTVSGRSNTLTPIGTSTDANGVMSATLSSTYAEVKTLKASVTRGNTTIALVDAPQVGFTAGPANQLVFTTQPTPAVAGGAFAPTVQVSAEDVQGNIVTAFSEAVTLTLSGGSSGATLTGTVSRSPVAGIVSFPGIAVSTSGTGYQLVAAATGLVSASSNAFDIGAPAGVLVFTSEPSNMAAGTFFAPQVTVALQDGQGNTLANAAGNVTLALDTNPNNATLGGTTTRSLTAGVVTFDDVTLTTVGVGYTLQASGANAGNANSTAFDVTPGPMSATASQFSATPNPVAVDTAATVTFAALDAYNNVLSGQTVSFTSNAPAGTATFSTASSALDANGRLSAAYVSSSVGAQNLTATVGGQSISTTLTVGAGSPNSTATKITFAPNPVTVNTNTTVTITVQDDFGNPVQGQAITFAGDGVQDAVGSTTGTTDVNGNANTLYSSTKAAVHTFTATLASVTFTGSVTFTAGNPNATASSMSVNPNAITTDQNATVTVQLVDDFGNNVAAASVTFGSSVAGFSYSANPATADVNGQAQTHYTGTKLGPVTLNANVASIVLTSNANVLIGSPNGTVSTVTATPSSVGADGVADTNVLLTLKDSAGNSIAGALPVWTVTGTHNTFTASGLPTDSNGQSTGTLSSTHAEVKTITATIGGTVQVVGVATFTAAPDATASSLTVNPTSSPADGTTTVALTVLVADGDGNPLANQNVTLAGSGRGDMFSTKFGPTDSSGTFSATLATAYAGNQNITAIFGSVTLTQQANFTVPVCAGTLLLPGPPIAVSGVTQESGNAMGDFTGDGIIDIAEVLPNSQLQVFAGNGKGGFASPIVTTLPHVPTALDTADVTADGKLDLIVADTQGFQVYQGNGNGTFTRLLGVAQNPNAPQVELIDLNHDNLVDLVALDAANGNITVNLRQGNNPGSMTSFSCTNGSAGKSTSFTVADFTGDSNADVLVTNQNGGINNKGYLALLRGNGDGTFQAFQEVDIDVNSSTPTFVANANFNADNYVDIVVVELNQAEMMLGNGDGTFNSTAKISLSSIYEPAFATVGDINNDSSQDVLVGGNYGEYIRIFGGGDGTFQSLAGNFESNIYPLVPYLVDLNSDGYLDLLSGGYFGVGARLGQGNGDFVAPLQTLEPNMTSFALGDLDGDGDLDVVTENNATIVSFTNDGNGVLAESSLQRTAAYSFIELSDLNGDKKPDYVTFNGATLITAIGDGAGGFGPEIDTSAPAAIYALQVGDLNGDGNHDVAAISNVANALYVFISNGDGTFQAPTSTFGQSLTTLAIGDTTGDGKPEVVATNATQLGVFVNQGDAAATMALQGMIYTLSSAPAETVVADINHDGRGDVVTALTTAASIWYAQGNADGTLAVQTSQTVIPPYSVRVGDMNGDGLLDMVAGGFGTQILYQKTDGTFTPFVMWDVGTSAMFPRLADMNGDGRLDYVAGDLVQSNPTTGLVIGLSSGCQ